MSPHFHYKYESTKSFECVPHRRYLSVIRSRYEILLTKVGRTLIRKAHVFEEVRRKKSAISEWIRNFRVT